MKTKHFLLNHGFAMMAGVIILFIFIALSAKHTSNNLADYECQSVWDHYCIYDLGIHPMDATTEDYDYFLDIFCETDGYEELYEIYHR